MRLTNKVLTRFTVASLGLLWHLGVAAPNMMAIPAGQMSFVPISPCRAVDTRLLATPDGLGGPGLLAGVKRDFAIWSSPNCSGIPSTVKAYAINITVVPSTTQLGYLSAWPAGADQPFVSTLNSPKGIVVANGATVPAGQNGAISLFATDMTDVIVDVNGYYIDQSNTGPQGPIGPAGPAGAQGATGLIGPAGAQGLIGLTGAAGPQGLIGLTGPAGPQGLIGLPGPIGPPGLIGVTGPAGPAGEVGAAGAAGTNGLGLMLSGVGSGSSNYAVMTTLAGGLTGQVTALPLAGYLGAPVTGTIPGGIFTLGDNSNFSGVMQTLPVDVTFTKLNATLTTKTALSLVGTSVSLTAQLYKYSGSSASAISGASCDFSPVLTGVLASETILTCSNSSMSAAYTAGDAGFIVISATAAGLSLINTVNANISVGVAQ